MSQIDLVGAAPSVDRDMRIANGQKEPGHVGHVAGWGKLDWVTRSTSSGMGNRLGKAPMGRAEC